VPNAMSQSLITCSSPADGVRLASMLAPSSAWKTTPAPDVVEGNGGAVTLYWRTAVVSATAVNTAVGSSRGSITASINVAHSVAGVVTNSKI
jgi:hypothetical protein